MRILSQELILALATPEIPQLPETLSGITPMPELKTWEPIPLLPITTLMGTTQTTIRNNEDNLAASLAPLKPKVLLALENSVLANFKNLFQK